MGHRAPSALDEATLAGRANEAVQHVLLGEAIDDGPALVFVADDSGGYAAVNRRVCETLGYTRAELLGKRVTDVAVDPDVPELYAAMLKSSYAAIKWVDPQGWLTPAHLEDRWPPSKPP